MTMIGGGMSRVFDRRVSAPDPKRLAKYGVKGLLRSLDITEPTRSYTWPIAFILDQGSEGACVAHGCTSELAAVPVRVDFGKLAHTAKLPGWASRTYSAYAQGATEQQAAQAFAFDLYDQCRRVDGDPGEDNGTTAATGASVLNELGFWLEYRWATDALDAAAAMVRQGGGPGTIACDWRTGMMNVDKSGFLTVQGKGAGIVEGGHQVCLLGYHAGKTAEGRYFLGVNSWGTSWGIAGPHITGGYFKIREEDVQYLLAEGGEFCIPVQRGTGAMEVAQAAGE